MRKSDSTKKKATKKKVYASQKLPRNAVTKEKLNIIKKKDEGKLKLPKVPVEGIAKKIASTGIPAELLEIHLDNLVNPPHYNEKPRREIGIRMLFCMAEGWSIKEAALLCGISDMTVYQFWGNPKSEYYDETFAKIISLGVHFSELWWTSMARANMTNKKNFDATLWMMNMSNRFGWTRKLDGKIIEKWTHIVDGEKKTNIHRITDKTIAETYKVLGEIGVIDKDEAIDVTLESSHEEPS